MLLVQKNTNLFLPSPSLSPSTPSPSASNKFCIHMVLQHGDYMFADTHLRKKEP